jgi:hypothetical protein
MFDSGSMGNFINERVVEQMQLTHTPQYPLSLHDVKGLKIGQIIHQVTVWLQIGAHEEQLTLDVAPIRTHSIILGLPWLQIHNPGIDWERAQV